MKTSTLIILAVVVVLVIYSPGGQSLLSPAPAKPPGATPGAGATRAPIAVPFGDCGPHNLFTGCLR
jgi:hypothetical protein